MVYRLLDNGHVAFSPAFRSRWLFQAPRTAFDTMSQPDSAEPEFNLSSELPTEEEYAILNGEDGCLDHYAQSESAINLVDLLRKGQHLGWTVKEVDGQAVLVPCIKDKSNAIVEHEMLKRQFPGASHMIKLILPFCNVATWALTPSAIAKSNARLEDLPEDSAQLKESARQEFSVRGARARTAMAQRRSWTKSTTNCWPFASTRAAEALIASKHPDFST